MKLRPYQDDSIEALRAFLRAAHKRIVLCASTGAGKSIVMLALILAAIAKGSRVLFICERRILVEQFSRHLDSAGIDHGVLMAKHWRYDPDALVQVASAQTLERMESWPAFDCVFVDELHACMRKSVIQLLQTFPHIPVIGSTATPFHPGIVKHFTAVANVITMRQLVEQGNLVPFRVFVAREIDVTGVPIVAGEFKKDELEARGRLIVGDVVADYIRIANEVFGGYRKTICFSSGVGHGADLVEKFQAAGINAVQLSYKDSDEYKAQVLADFARPDTGIQVLISADILTRGYDQTDVEHVILARPLKKSFSSHVQMVGRGARPHEGKKFCVIQDHSNNWLRFADSWEELYTQGVRELSSTVDAKPRKEPTQREKERAKCPKCGSLWPGKADMCPHCGHVRPRANPTIEIAGEMEELSAAKRERVTQEYKRQFYAELLAYARNRGWKSGSAYWAYRDKFGVGPAGSKPEPAPAVSPEVANWMLHRNIKRAKSPRP